MAPGKETRFVVLGFPRSGTTLLARLLDAHPEISCPPETHLLTSAGMFLTEQTHVEGPPIGVLSALSFRGIAPSEVLQQLREMVFGFHEKMADGAPLWVEKTGADIFQIEALEELLAGHVRFIAVLRNPLDVVPSNVDLADRMGEPLLGLQKLTRDHPNRYEGIASAWINRTEALDSFVDRHPAECFRLKYEDLTAAPSETLRGLLNWMGAEDKADQIVQGGLRQEPRIGLGDFRINDTISIRPHDPKAWRKRVPRATASRIVPMLAPLMERHGYDVPKVPRIVNRADAVRQFEMAAQMQRNQTIDQAGE